VSDTNASSTMTTPFASTDMLRRRVPLNYSCQLPVEEPAVFIRTNAPLIAEAVRGHVSDSGFTGGHGLATWEITVEFFEHPMPSQIETDDANFESCRFPSGSAMRMICGSWFVHTPPSLDGVGFAFVSGSKSCQVQQLTAYLAAVLRFLADGRPQFVAISEFGVCK